MAYRVKRATSSAVEYGIGRTFLSMPCGLTKRVRSILSCLASAFIWATNALAVVRLKADVVFHDAGKGLLRDRNHLIEVARFLFRPIQDHTCGGDFGQAANLRFLSGFLRFQNVAGL